MPKVIKSAATKDTSSASNDADLQELEKHGEPPADPAFYNDYDLDLKDNDASLQRTANKINRKQTRP